MNPQGKENCNRDFSIELTSYKHWLSILSTDMNGGVLLEGTLGKLQYASFVEPEILEVKGSYGVLRLHLRLCEITVSDSAKKCTGGDME
ncbi:MAG: hypothetical protein ACFE7R_04590 [Candidatus Hodarchaeota archaeon]